MNFAAVFQSMIVCDGPNCTFDDLVTLAKAVMNNLVVVATVVVTIILIWIGFTLLTSGGSESKKEAAKRMAFNAVIGFVFVLAAWLIVYTISSVLLKGGFSYLGNKV